MVLGIFNPATIILLGFSISKWSEKMESLKVVMTGIGMYLIGLFIIGFTLNWYGVIIGIVIASIGEFMVAPGYYAFVSRLAPKDKVSAYLGCNFLSSMTGLFFGTLIFGQLYNVIGAGMERPRMFYGILIALGLLLLIGFMVYYRAWGQDIIHRAKAIKEKEEGIAAAADVREPALFRLFDKKGTALFPALIIPVVLIATFSMGTDVYAPPIDEEEIVVVEYEGLSIPIDAGDYVNEGDTVTIPFNVTGIPQWFNFTITWTDEPSSRPMGTNTADAFRIVLTSPLGIAPDGGSAESYDSPVSISLQAPDDPTGWTGDWTLEVTCTDAGDVRSRGPLGRTLYTDDGNDYALTGEVTTLVEKEV
jgi:MFS family permease